MISEPLYSMLLRIWEKIKCQSQLHTQPVGSCKKNLPQIISDKTAAHLCRHDEAGGGGVDGDITGHQSHILELLVHLSVLLVGEGLDGAGEDHPLLLSKGQRNGIPAGDRLRVRSLSHHRTSQTVTQMNNLTRKVNKNPWWRHACPLTRHRQSCQQRCVQIQAQTRCCRCTRWPHAGKGPEQKGIPARHIKTAKLNMSYTAYSFCVQDKI